MEKIEAKFRIVTPMFLGNAEQDTGDGVRPPSVKGALRFWWRALSWARFRGQPGASDVSALKALHEQERSLFGSASDDNGNGRQGCFLLRVFSGPLKRTPKAAVHHKFNAYAAARYLAYGLMVAFGRADGTTHSGQLERDCLDQNQEFTVRLLFRNSIDLSVLDALIAWGLLGGLGSRSRHGMGSVALVSLDCNGQVWDAPTNEVEYEEKIKALFAGLTLSYVEPPFSAFWRGARIDRLVCGDNSYSVLDAFGKAMLLYRSWGRSVRGGARRVLDSISEQRFKDDHDWYRVDGWATKYPNFHPRRTVFGLPHNYHRNHHHVTSEGHARRASPLLFHVHPVGQTFIGIGIYLRSQFLPDGEKIMANNIPVTAAIDWSVITDFLDGKVGNAPQNTATPRFPYKKTLVP